MPLTRFIDPERAHNLALRALAAGLVRPQHTADPPQLGVRALGALFPNPIGLAAGFDKNGTAILPLMQLGFGFVEAGTVTRLPQAGNARPRLFRLSQNAAVINRMGFNNEGLGAFSERLLAASRRPYPLGANLGLNKTGADPERDYSYLATAVAPHVDYITINVSSPNTPGLRDLQGAARLRGILRAICQALPVCPPVLVKIAPDLSDVGLDEVVCVAVEEGAAGLIVGNTTISRPPGLAGSNRHQAGGLSGAPLFSLSTDMLRRTARLARGRLVLVGCGGIRTGADVLTKIKAGASLVQLYTAFAYAGPSLLPRLKEELLAALRAEGFATISEAIGTDL